MTRKILTASVRKIDEKGHVKSWKTCEINLGSITFKVDQESESKPKKEPKKVPKTDSKKDSQ